MRLELKIKDTTKDMWFEALKEGPPMKNVSEKKVVKQEGPNSKVIYLRVSVPIMSDREQLVHWQRIDLNEKESILLLQSILMDEYPITANIVRAQMFKCMLIRQDDENPKDLRVSDVSNFNMKGYMPARLMNMAMTTMFSKGLGEII